MENYNGFSEENLREIAKKKVVYRFSVRLHVIIFLIVNSLLFFINMLTTPSFYWVAYPFFAWLIGVAEHLTIYIVYAKGIYPNAKRGLIFHIIAYIFVNLLLFIIFVHTEFYVLRNVLVIEGYITYAWFLFPLVFWGAGLLIHIAVYLIFSRNEVDNEGIKQSKREKAIEREIEKMKSKFKK
ncbi:MAG: 2TM domain-containing protein [Candidatus Lokiarchaeota archaeon]|nr:2TM domain-containing protein [Candidatus Lokiarchaeota archaeon]